MSEIEDIVGGVVSTTSTCCVANAEFPLLSIAVQIIVDEPNGNKVGALLIINWMPLSSIAMASPRSTVVKLPVASITKSAGVDIIGLVVSGTSGSSGVEVSSTGSVSDSSDSVSDSSDSSA